MLSTKEAVYSFGNLYRPYKVPYSHIKQELSQVQHFLMLGTGLGSGLKILQKDWGIYPKADLVDIDPTIIYLSQKYMNLNKHHNVQWHCTDASSFIATCIDSYDFIGVDLFIDMNVPNYFKSVEFYKLLHNRLHTNGICLFNNIFFSSNERAIIQDRISSIFSKVNMIDRQMNTFTIAYK